MELPRPDIDPDGLLEYSVVFTDRALNHMSAKFRQAMVELLDILRETYHGSAACIVPGGGSYAMEAVARQLMTDEPVLIVRNGFFSYRWSQIIEAGSITDRQTVLCAREAEDGGYAPAPTEEVEAAIAQHRPKVVCAAHVETASGMLLPDEYLRRVAAATHEVGGLFVLDCIASGPLWVDMGEIGVDVLISAPQKGWSGTPCAGYVILSEEGRRAVEATGSTSFSLGLGTWLKIADAYVAGGHAYHATMPTDALLHNLEVMREAREMGLETLRERQIELGAKVRSALEERGYASVAASGWQSPTVVVCRTDDPGLAGRLIDRGVQIAAGVPLKVGEPEDFTSFRIGLFGLDKWADIDSALSRLTRAFDALD
ncbi:MAG: aminotransferase class V-fold PLP-dependent enzyme [Flaviflexus sp.]|nr:aminotransferase class V-fold PLP-dependent enzyme [Flaviflexus sp.]